MQKNTTAKTVVFLFWLGYRRQLMALFLFSDYRCRNRQAQDYRPEAEQTEQSLIGAGVWRTAVVADAGWRGFGIVLAACLWRLSSHRSMGGRRRHWFIF